MSKVVKGIGKAVKGVFKGVKKVFKKIVSSKIGQLVLVAAAIYFTGPAGAGWWGTAAETSAATALGGAAGADAVAVGAGEALAPIAVDYAGHAAAAPTLSSMAAQGAAPAVTAAAQPLGAGVAEAAVADAVAPAVVETATPAFVAQSAGQEAATGGILDRLLTGAGQKLSSVAGWVDKNPYPAALGMVAAAGALSPDEQDLMEEEWKREDRERRRRSLNMDVGDVSMGIRPAQRENSRTGGGFLNNRMASGV